ncbi:MAG: hypothetical protein U0S49_07010 [Rhodospirillales bacterium]|nr:hypothetical protein [Rhodospirillales bacterium]
MRRSIISCFACALVIAMLATIGLYGDADAGLPDDGGLYSSTCTEVAAAVSLPADEVSSDREEERLPTYAQTDPQNSCTKCEKGKKRCCISGNCRTVSC